MPAKYQEDSVLEFIFNTAKVKSNDTHIDYKRFIDMLIDDKDMHDFFNFKDVITSNYFIIETC